jgi:hypothetical protein
MRSTILLRTAALATLAGFAATALPAHQQQQDPNQQSTTDPVADAARKAREQKKAEPKPKHVFTNDDMPAPAEKPAASKSEGASKDATADQTDADKDKDSANDPKSEVYWRKRFKEVRDKLANAEKELDVLQRELNKNQVQYYSDPQKALVQQYNRSDINDGAGKIDA